MNAPSLSDHHVSDSPDSQRLGRAFAAKLDMKSLGVTEGDVALWRAGITLPRTADCRRLSELLHVDVVWLNAGSKPANEGERKSDEVSAVG